MINRQIKLFTLSMIFVMVVLFGFNISIVNAQEEDTFQQVINSDFLT